jgi:hypothetical protein
VNEETADGTATVFSAVTFSLTVTTGSKATAGIATVRIINISLFINPPVLKKRESVNSSIYHIKNKASRPFWS